jgi:hypothetical protein
MDEIYYDLQKAIDFAFVENKFVLNSYSYLKVKDVRRVDAQEVLRSPLIKELYVYINDLETIVRGGQEKETVYLREAYGFLSKPEARKISIYFDKIIEGFKTYINDRKPGRKKKTSVSAK